MMRPREMVGTTRCDGVDRRKWYWLVGANTGLCDHRQISIGCRTGCVLRHDCDRRKLVMDKRKRVEWRLDNCRLTAREGTPKRCWGCLNMNRRQSATNESYGALLGSASDHSLYDFGQCCSMTVRKMYIAGADESTRFTLLTDHTLLQRGDTFQHKFPWLVWHLLLKNTILNKLEFLMPVFFTLIWS